MAKVLVLHGPNLNLLGSREESVYGSTTLADINTNLTQKATELGHTLTHFQSNSENELVDAIQKAKGDNVAFIIINPAAFTHTSVAIRDAFLGVQIPFIEVHISNVKAREAFRHESYLIDVAVGGIFGCGAYGYELALLAANHFLKSN